MICTMIESENESDTIQRHSIEHTLSVHKAIAEENQRDIDQIYKDMVDMNAIFVDLSNIIQQQGEDLDMIQNNIEKVVENTEQASAELEKTSTLYKKRGSRKCACGILGALVGFGIGGPIGFAVGSKAGLVLVGGLSSACLAMGMYRT